MQLSSEQADIAKKLWQTGHQSGQIVKYFNGMFTRNQIIGKLYRMGALGHKGDKRYRRVAKDAIEHRLATRKSPGKPLRKTSAAEATQIALSPNAAQRSFNGDCGPIYDIMELKRDNCHWPIGNPEDKNFCYCGARVDKGPYCPTHSSLAYEPWIRSR